MWTTRLILRNIGRHKLRTLLTILGLALAVMAFALIRSLVDSFYASTNAIPPDRLVTRSSVSIIFALPISYKEKIERVPGVESVVYANWFGGLYNNDIKNFFPSFAVGPEDYLDVYSEYVLQPDQKEAYFKTKNGAFAGQKLANRFGWKAGDPIRLTGQIYPGDWDFILDGIYTGKTPDVDENAFFFHWDYLDETMRQSVQEMSGQAGWYSIKIKDPQQAAAISAAVDDLFKNSSAETLTETEKAFSLSFIGQMDTIIKGLKAISFLIIGIILLVLVNTMAMSVRERMSEYALLKTLGFGPLHLISLIFGESIGIALLGGFLGILLTFPVLHGVANMLQNFFSGFQINNLTIVLAMLFVLLVGLLASIFPIYKAVKVSIIEGLRNVG